MESQKGYAPVNGIRMYHEIYGAGEPLVLIHGGLTTIGEMQGWVQVSAQTRRVIAVELPGWPPTTHRTTFRMSCIFSMCSGELLHRAHLCTEASQ